MTSLDHRLPPGFLEEALRANALSGLTSEPKSLPPKWFYEQRAALRVIEPLGRQRLGLRREPAERVGTQCFLEEPGRQPAVEGCHRIVILASSVCSM